MAAPASAPSTHENPKFREFIQSVLERAHLGPKYIEAFTDKTSMIEFTKAFTHKSIDPVDNYEFYEILGDSTTNKVVVWYFIRRFPEVFNDAKGKGGNMGPVAIMARLKQNGVSKTTYAQFSETLGFWDYVRRTDEENKNRKKIMEDVFEAFCGCLELLVDTKVTDHSGYGIVYKIMKTLMDPIKVSLERDELYDAKSRLNEVILGFRGRLIIKYVSEEDKSVKGSMDPTAYQRRYQVKVNIFDRPLNKTYQSVAFYGPSLKDAEKKAAQYVLDSDMVKKIPPI
ncbi:MAG: ribonuclease III domain-containing protein [Candidatus Colwellbacteria bacterium]|nr:ribonuclease III domain-containing protein [Candidatus Colwellbacteria bacterium]